MKKDYKLNEENITIRTRNSTIFGLLPSSSAFPHREIIVKSEGYIYATPWDRIQVVLINFLIICAIYSLASICHVIFLNERFLDYDLFIFISIVFLCVSYSCNLGMIIKKMYIVNEKIEKASYYPKLKWQKNQMLPSIDSRRRAEISTESARVIAIFLFFLIVPLFIISVICLFKTEKHQMLHDILLDEYVVKKIK